MWLSWVVMFLFVIGLEMKPPIWGLRGQIFGLGSMQVVLSALLLTGWGCRLASRGRWPSSAARALC
jgi:Kef-type K+ transport system membrane component KefB